MELEQLALDIARLAVDYLAVKKRIAPKPPTPSTKEDTNDLFEEIANLTKEINQGNRT